MRPNKAHHHHTQMFSDPSQSIAVDCTTETGISLHFALPILRSRIALVLSLFTMFWLDEIHFVCIARSEYIYLHEQFGSQADIGSHEAAVYTYLHANSQSMEADSNTYLASLGELRSKLRDASDEFTSSEESVVHEIVLTS